MRLPAWPGKGSLWVYKLLSSPHMVEETGGLSRRVWGALWSLFCTSTVSITRAPLSRFEHPLRPTLLIPSSLGFQHINLGGVEGHKYWDHSIVTSHYFYCTLFFRSKSIGPAHMQGERITQKWEYQEDGITWESCWPHALLWLIAGLSNQTTWVYSLAFLLVSYVNLQ